MTVYRCRWAEHGLALHNSGTALLCCHSRTPLQDHQGQQIYWHTHTIQDALHSPTRRDIQAALARGEQPYNCEACFSVERAGGESRRQATNQLEISSIDAEIRMLDLKLGNICNLSCRTCNPWVSSKWYSDWWAVIDSHKQEHIDYRDYLNEKHLTAKISYAEDNEQFWQQLKDIMPGADYIDVYGAEPMMIDRLWPVLQHSVETGSSERQIIHFNTNATIWQQERINVLDGFHTIFVDLSLDGTEKQFEYLRNGADWIEVLENLGRYQRWMHNRHLQKKEAHVSICITISVFNVLYLPEITSFFDRFKQFHMSWHINHAHMPHWINFKIFPDEVKTAIRSTLEHSKIGRDPHYCDMIDRDVLGYMDSALEHPAGKMSAQQYQQEMFQEWVRVTRALDQRRDQDFAATFPELWELVRPWW